VPTPAANDWSSRSAFIGDERAVTSALNEPAPESAPGVEAEQG